MTIDGIADSSTVVRAMSHRVLVMKDGSVVEQGEAQALFDAPREPYTRELLAAARLRIRIPMPGAVESLNVAAAAAVCLFEALRRKMAPRA